MIRLGRGTAIAAALAVAAAGAAGSAATALRPPALARLRVKVLAEHPHDRSSFTQGLLFADGKLYESTGLSGESALLAVDLMSGTAARRVDLAPDVFGEGLALAGDRLVQLTWREGKAYVYSRRDFSRLAEWELNGEGWGLTFDGKRFWQSDGSSTLRVRDASTFREVGKVQVTQDGTPREDLNELEWVNGEIYANVWTTDDIVRIDPASGRVTAVIDASGLLTPSERAAADVLNGIAYDPAKRVFYITGKHWPKLFEVVFVPR